MLAVLWATGFSLSRLMLPHSSKLISASLALPFAGIANVMIVLFLDLLSIPLSPVAILLSLMIICIAAHIGAARSVTVEDDHVVQAYPMNVTFRILCAFILASALIYGFSHAVLLPTFHYDSATNWNMRSKIGFLEKRLPFDDAGGLIRKPHYPPLYHALQITAMQGQNDWREPIANGTHFLLTLSAFTAVYLIIRKLRGGNTALLTVALIIGIPLLTLHTGQSYADLTLVQTALLSLVFFLWWIESGTTRYLLLSSIFVGGCVLTKSEGIPFCFLPWTVMTLLQVRKQRLALVTVLRMLAPAALLSLLWISTVALKDVPLSPHGASDVLFGWNKGALSAIAQSLFSEGSFGVTWCAILLLLPFTMGTSNTLRVGLVWGAAASLGYVALYAFTDNAVYLLSGQSFDRQMLLPASLFILSIGLSLSNLVNPGNGN